MKVVCFDRAEYLMPFPPDPPLDGTEPELTGLASFIRERRDALGLTQEMLAEASSLSHRSISAIELGRSHSPHRRTIDLLARGLRLTLHERQELRALVPPRSHPTRKHVRVPPALPVEPAALDSRLLPEGADPPWPDGPLIGQRTLVDQALAILTGQVRLLTLTGPPGVGKTRLAVEIGRHPEIASVSDAVAFVPLAQARTIAEAIGQINAVLGITVSAPPSPTATLVGFLRRASLLLILDNVEQIPGIASLLARLVQDAPAVRLLVTSRHISHLALGRQIVLRPLDLPPLDQIADPAGFPSIDSVAFLLDRLVRTGVRLRLTEAVMADLAVICRAMDGLPLALELAAARLRSMTPAELVERLRSRRTVRRPRPGATHHRHRTLHAAITWSIDLLTPEAQATLACLSVFSGGFTSAAAVAVVSGGAPEETRRTLSVTESLAELVDQHLLVFDHAGPDQESGEDQDGRFHLLETIRDVASDLLTERGDSEATRCAHARWCLSMVEIAELGLQGDEPGAWLRRLDRETGNIREAIDFLNGLAEAGDENGADMGLNLSARLWQFWRVRGLSDEGQRRIERSLEVAEPVLGLGPHPSRARALNNLGILVLDEGDTLRTRALFEASLAMSRSIADGRGVADTVNNLGMLAVYHGNYVDAQEYHLEAYRIRLPLGDPQRMIMSMQNLGDVALDTGLLPLATQFHTDGIRIAHEIGDRTSAAYGYMALGEVEIDLGNAGLARRFLTRSLDIFSDIGDQLGLGFLANTWGYLAHQQDDHRAALEWQQRAIGHWQRSNNRRGQVAAIEAIALTMFALGRLRVTAELLATAHRIRSEERMGRPPKRNPPLRQVADALAASGHDALDTSPTPMSLDRVTAFALRLDPVLRRQHRPRLVRSARRPSV